MLTNIRKLLARWSDPNYKTTSQLIEEHFAPGGHHERFMKRWNETERPANVGDIKQLEARIAELKAGKVRWDVAPEETLADIYRQLVDAMPGWTPLAELTTQQREDAVTCMEIIMQYLADRATFAHITGGE